MVKVSNNINKLNILVTQFKDDIGQKLSEEIEAGEDLNKQVEMLAQVFKIFEFNKFKDF